MIDKLPYTPEMEDTRRFFTEIWQDRQRGELTDSAFLGMIRLWTFENLEEYRWKPIPSMPHTVQEWIHLPYEEKKKMSSEKKEKFREWEQDYRKQAKEALLDNWSNYLHLKECALYFLNKNDKSKYREIKGYAIALLKKIQSINHDFKFVA